MLSWIAAGSTGAKFLVYGFLALSLMGGAATLKLRYDASIIASVAAKQAAANLVIERADNARKINELTSRAIVAEAEAANYASIKGAIAHAPITKSCLATGDIRAAVDGLRSDASNH